MQQSRNVFGWVFNKKKQFALACFAAVQAMISPVEGDISGKEALSLRRIAEFWKDGDFEIAQRQILEFLDQYPESSASDHLLAMLGDLYFQEKKFQPSFSTYDKIKGEEFKQKTRFQCLVSLFELRDFPAAAAVGELYFQESHPAGETIEAHFLTGEAFLRSALKEQHAEDQKQLAEKALVHYKQLASSKYEENILFSLAEVQRLLKNYPEAVEAYLALAKKYPDRKNELLFQAATIQVYLDKEKAIEIFNEIAASGGKNAQAAAYNQMVLLFEAGRYQDFLNLYGERRSLIPENKSSLMLFYVGKSHYALGRFQECVEPLLDYVNTEAKESADLKNALLCLVHCAQMSKNISLLEESLKELKESFPTDPDRAKWLLLHAQMSIENNAFEQAHQDLTELTSGFPDFVDQESIYYTRAFLFSKEKKWEESRMAFLIFLEKFPESRQEIAARRHLVNCSLQQIKGGGELEAKKHLAVDLASLLNRENGLNSSETKDFRFLLAKILFEVSEPAQAAEELERYLAHYPEDQNSVEAHLLAARCYEALGNAPEAFIEHTEKALDLKPDLPHQGLFHLHLYNAYLSLGEKDLAADHLFLGWQSKEGKIRQENQLWLADYYYLKAKSEPSSSQFAARASQLFESILKTEEGKLNTKQDPIALEGEVLKYADLLASEQRTREKIDLLKMLVEHQEELSEAPWKYQRRALFELGRAYELASEKENALKIYDSLVNTSTHTASYMGTAALLHRSRLQYESLDPQEKTETDPQVLEILNAFKEMQIRKNVHSEPLHLEAAFDYAEIRASLTDEENREERYLFFLTRIKEDFSSEEDPFSKEYTLSRKQFEEKEQLFQNYMKYLDAEKMRVEAIVYRKKGELQAAATLEKQVAEEMQSLLVNSSNPYLSQRLEKSLQAMRAQ